MTRPLSKSFRTRRPALAGTARSRVRRALASALLLLGAGLGGGQAAAEVSLRIDGLPEQLEENVRIYVGKLPDDNDRAVRRFKRDLDDRTRVALSALGYYAADIEVDSVTEMRKPTRKELKAAAERAAERAAKRGDEAAATPMDPDEEREHTTIIIAATPNDPVRVGVVDLQILGPARLDADFMSVVRRMPLQKGEVFLSGDYEGLKGLLLDQAQDLGYFDLRFTTAEVRVSRQRLTAGIKLVVESGERYTFGNILFDQDAFTEEFLLRWLSFEPGDPFSVDAVSEVTQNLRNSGYFTSVRVIPQRDDRYGTAVPVRISLVKKENNLVGVGIGYATDIDGPRFSLSWEKPLINRQGHSAEANFLLSRPRQSLGFGYKIPRRDQPLTNFWGIEFGILHEDFDESETETLKSTLNFQRVTRTTHDFTQSLFIRWEREQSTIAEVEDTTDLIMPGVSYTRSRRKGSPFITWGQSETFSVYGGSDRALSSIDLFKVTGELRYLRGFFERSTFIGALQLGWIESNDFDRVPASQRFFAGGDRSVRGFRFRDIGPRNLDGDPVGGRYLEVATVEYNYRFRDAWSAATFIDVGRAFNNYDTGYSAGAGVGIRWQSPVGPFRVDVARPISDGDGEKFRFHLSLGPDL